MAATCSTSVSVEGFVNKMHGCTVRNAQGHREAEDAVALLTAQSQVDCMLTPQVEHGVSTDRLLQVTLTPRRSHLGRLWVLLTVICFSLESSLRRL